MRKKLFALVALGLMWQSSVEAQTNSSIQGIDHSYKPMTLKLDDKGSKFIRFITWHQFWLSHTANNPGTLDINGNDQKSSPDFGIRRSRFLVHAQISPRFLILSHWGINNQIFDNGGATAVTNFTGVATTPSNAGKKPQLFIHDAWTEYTVVPEKLSIGGGLHYWNGVSRSSSASTLTFMTMDAPIFNWHNIETTDQFARQFGIYAKGYLGKLDYRVAINKPFSFGLANNNTAIKSTTQANNILNENWATQGYLSYNFWDKENNTLPFYAGSYLGAKKVFNIGAGWYNHAGATGKRVSATDSSIATYTQTNLGVDVFLDMPLNKSKGTAISAYSVFYNNNYGPNYLRNVGIMNQHGNVRPISADSNSSWAGGGNAQPTLGTGNIWYTQAGYLFPKNKKGAAVMPYVAYTYKDLERIGTPSSQVDLGVNYFITGHQAKITGQYSTRPVYKTNADGTIGANGSKGQFIVQSHIFL